MKYISVIITVFTLGTSFSFAGMIADDSIDQPPIPPKQISIITQGIPTAKTNIIESVKTEKKNVLPPVVKPQPKPVVKPEPKTVTAPKPVAKPQPKPVVKTQAKEVPAPKPVKPEQKIIPTPKDQVKTEPKAVKQLPVINTDKSVITEKKTEDVPVSSANTSAAKHLSHDFSVFAAAGAADGNIKSAAIGIDIYSKAAWFNDGNWYITPYTEILVGYWEGDKGHTGVDSLHEAGLSLYGRFVRHRYESVNIRPYLDLGLGLHYLTEDKIEGKELGRQWLAGSNVGIGLIFGKSEQIDIGLRIRHLSNAGTKDTNWGINHIMGRVAVRF